MRPVLEAVTDSRVPPSCSALPGRQRRDPGPWGGDGARFCSGRRVCAAGISAVPLGDPSGTGGGG